MKATHRSRRTASDGRSRATEGGCSALYNRVYAPYANRSKLGPFSGTDRLRRVYVDKSHTFSSQGDQASARPQKVERTLVPRRTHAPRRTRAGCAVGTGLAARGRRSRPPNVRHASDAQAPSLFGMLVRGDQCVASSASLKVVETRRKRCYAAPRRAVSRLQVRQTMAAGSR